MKKTIRLLLMSALIAAPAIASAELTEVQARESLTRLTERYRTTKYGASDEISTACLGEIFHYWFSAYDRSSHEELGKLHSRISAYQDARRLALSHEQDTQKLYPEMRPNLIKATREAIAESRSRAEIPDIPGPMSLAEIYAPAYEANLKKCMSSEYIQTIEQRAPYATNLNITAMITGKLYSVLRTGGGGGGGGGGGMTSLVGAVVSGSEMGPTAIFEQEATLSIADWLDTVRAR